MEAPPLDRIRDQLSLGPTSAAALAKALGVHQSTISRAIASLQANGDVVRLHGPTRGARYALTRRVGSVGSSWPLYRIDSTGSVTQLGVLHALARDDYYLRSETALAGLSEGIPYPLQDVRPAGFLGRTVSQRYPELALPLRVNDWNDEHFLHYLTQRGADCTGDFLIERTFIPPRPKAAALGAWRSARSLALAFWDRLTTEQRLSAQFRQIATACRQAVNDSPAP
jgi:DNA-binding transcriptional ArsR family regulator